MLEVFFAATPNGWKVSIALEELKAAGCDIDWKVVNVNLATDMFTDWYMEVSPNSKMPAIRDDGFTMFESGAILHYLADKFPGVLLPKDPHKKWTALSWLHWQMANVGPMFGNRLTLCFPFFLCGPRGWELPDGELHFRQNFVKNTMNNDECDRTWYKKAKHQ